MKLKIKFSTLKQHLWLLLLALPLCSPAEDAGSLFKKGNQFYAKAQYQQAAQTYQQILGEGYQSAAVYFNLGNAYYKQDDMPSAILYYEKARKLKPADQDISINIQFANLKIADKIESAPEFFVNRWWHNLILALPANQFAGISALLILSGFILLIVYVFANIMLLKKACFYIGIFVIGCGLIGIFTAQQQLSYFNARHQAIIFSSSVVVKSAPDANGKPLFVLHDGTKVDISRQNGNWVEIALANGNTGWITLDKIKEI